MILEKTKFMMQYEKYVKNLQDFNLEKLVLGEEEKIMLIPVEKGFKTFIKEFHSFLNELYRALTS